MTRDIESGGKFKLTNDQLESFYDPKSLKNLMELGGIDAVARDLDTDVENGLPVSLGDLDEREDHYGVNSIPQKPPKSFLRICWDVMHDRVLIILSIAAVVSLALGLYETFGQPPTYDAEGKAEPRVEWVEGVAIIVAIAIVMLVSAANDYNKERQFMKLNNQKEDREIVVFRGGEKHYISINDLLVGDVLCVETGDVVPGDSILISGSCECDESSLTGETDTIRKCAAKVAIQYYEDNHLDTDIGDPANSDGKKVLDPILISGSKLVAGQGRALVTAVGVHSMHGKIMMSLRHENETTPLQLRLEHLADSISKYAFMIAGLLFVILMIRFFVDLKTSLKSLTPAEKGTRFLNILITAITVIVVAIPEGLPLAVTLALAFATTRMTKDGNLVRVLKSCETMGSATAVCSDKTGTLTENKMRVVRGFVGSSEFDDTVSAGAEARSSQDAATNVDPSVRDALIENILLNSTAFENHAEDDFDMQSRFTNRRLPWYKRLLSKDPESKAEAEAKQKQLAAVEQEPFIGSKTECALLLMVRDGFCAIDQPIQMIRNQNEPHYAQVIPFESSRKWGGLVMKHGNGYRFYIKGASELVFALCRYRALSDGSVEKVTSAVSDKVQGAIYTLAGDALRTIALAHRDFEVDQWPPAGMESSDNPEEADVSKLFAKSESDNVESGVPSITINGQQDQKYGGLILDGLVGIQDPLRPGVKEAIAKCHTAGVTVRMVTGDNILTARAISKSCGILPVDVADDPELCMEGPKFRMLAETDRLRIVPKLRVLARSSPEDKRVLVATLKQLGEVVAVTGDGTNDAPALKLADVGFSMGISGTEVAREASDIILMTDDFSSIVNAIKWGRTVSTSIRKFVQFQLTVNITACVLTMVSSIANSDSHSVLTAVQLLWVNLIMDTLGALALATDKPDENVLNRKPMGRNAPLISTSMWKMIMGQACMQLIVTMLLNFDGSNLFYPGRIVDEHQSKKLDSLVFNTFVWMQVTKLFVARKLDEGDGLTTVKSRCTRENLDFFEHVFRNPYFIGIELIISGFQVLIMFVGGSAFSIGIQTGPMWATALLCGFLSFPVGWIVRITPDIWVERIFPTKAFNKFLDYCEFGPIRRKVKSRKGAKAAPNDEEAISGASKEQVLNVPLKRKRSLSSSTNDSSVADTLVASGHSAK